MVNGPPPRLQGSPPPVGAGGSNLSNNKPGLKGYLNYLVQMSFTADKESKEASDLTSTLPSTDQRQ